MKLQMLPLGNCSPLPRGSHIWAARSPLSPSPARWERGKPSNWGFGAVLRPQNPTNEGFLTPACRGGVRGGTVRRNGEHLPRLSLNSETWLILVVSPQCHIGSPNGLRQPPGMPVRVANEASSFPVGCTACWAAACSSGTNLGLDPAASRTIPASDPVERPIRCQLRLRRMPRQRRRDLCPQRTHESA